MAARHARKRKPRALSHRNVAIIALIMAAIPWILGIAAMLSK